MGTIMRESDEMLSFGVGRFAFFLLSAPVLPIMFRDVLPKPKCWLPFFSLSLSLPGYGNTAYDECDAAGTHLTVLLWIQRSDFTVLRSKLPN